MIESNSFESLVSQSAEERNEQWELAFLERLPDARINILNSTPQTGPDGWPYLMVETSVDGREPMTEVLAWLAEKGIGLAVNPQKDAPDYVLSYGMVWNFREFGKFLSPVISGERGRADTVHFQAGAKVQAGPPSAQYLPDYVRQILRVFFHGNGIQKPKILIMSQDQKNYDLCFSLDSLGSPDASEHQGILEGLSWFLPPHYSLVLVSERGLPPFHDL